MRLKGDYSAFYDVASERGFEDFGYFNFVNCFAVEVEDFGGYFAHGSSLFFYPCGDSNETLMIFGVSGTLLGGRVG